MLTMLFNGIRLWQSFYRQWQASSVPNGYFFKHVLPNLWPNDKPLPAKLSSDCSSACCRVVVTFPIAFHQNFHFSKKVPHAQSKIQKIQKI